VTVSRCDDSGHDLPFKAKRHYPAFYNLVLFKPLYFQYFFVKESITEPFTNRDKANWIAQNRGRQ
jgi:hypothetical protein